MGVALSLLLSAVMFSLSYNRNRLSHFHFDCRCLAGRPADDAARQQRQPRRWRQHLGRGWAAARDFAELPIPTRRSGSSGKPEMKPFSLVRYREDDDDEEERANEFCYHIWSRGASSLLFHTPVH